MPPWSFSYPFTEELKLHLLYIELQIRYILNGQVLLLWEAGKTMVCAGKGTREPGFAHLRLGALHAALHLAWRLTQETLSNDAMSKVLGFKPFNPGLFSELLTFALFQLGRRKSVFFTGIEQRCKILYMSSFMLQKNKNVFRQHKACVFLHVNPCINSWKVCKLKFCKTNNLLHYSLTRSFYKQEDMFYVKEPQQRNLWECDLSHKDFWL